MSKVYLAPPKEMSKGIGRVAKALAQYAPDAVHVVDRREEADLVVFHVAGVQNFDTVDLPTRIQECVDKGQRYAMVQYCWATTEVGKSLSFWWPLWSAATCVWSYYDLDEQAGSPDDCLDNFYYAPLGADPQVFARNARQHKLFKIGTSGYVAETEGVLECAAAAKATGNWHFHLGPDFGLGATTAVQSGLTDLQVADRWRECEYVAGLRRVEGFELPAVEALFCGSRPILFAAPHYRKWFDGLGEFIPEDTFEHVRNALINVFDYQDYKMLTNDEHAEALRRFAWEPLVKGFWERAL